MLTPCFRYLSSAARPDPQCGSGLEGGRGSYFGRTTLRSRPFVVPTALVATRR